MRFISGRGLVPACMAAAATMALVAPGSALAKKASTQCSGVNIEGQGSSAQKLIEQNFWTLQFNSSAAKTACSGTQGTGGKPTVKYNSTGSGAGLKSWGMEPKEGETPNYGPTNSYIGTEDPPNAAESAEFLKHESTETAETLLTIPVMQLAVAVIMHVPTGCTATSTASPGKLVISQATLQGVYAGTVKTWGAIKDGGDALTGAGCAEAKVQPVVRQDESGTTHVFMKFLGLLNSSPLETAKGNRTWDELSEGQNNTTWPTAAGVIHAEKSGGGELVKVVAKEPGTIGYAALADARANASFGSAGGAGQPTFWAPLENENKKGKAKFAEPSTNGEIATAASSNCKKTVYSNGSLPFPPPSVTEFWNEVTSKTSEKTYALCGFSFALSSPKYSLLPGTSAGEAETVKNFLGFVTDKKSGQLLLEGTDYEALPKSVLGIATGGVAAIGN
jgi:ABC-type phosphate transport system substrate-binding protein